MSKNLLVVRDVISREIYELENKIMESRLAKLKYKYLEDKKEILVDFLQRIDNELLFPKTKREIFSEEDIEMPII